MSGACSPTRGIIFGGAFPANSSKNIDVFTMASGGNAIKFGELITARKYHDTSGNATRGIFAGFYPASGGGQRMDFVTITSAGNASDFGDLTTAAYYTGGCSDSNGGLGE